MSSGTILPRHDSDSDDEDSPKNSGNGGRMQELLASYYGMQRGGDRTSDMESTTFDSKAYIRGLLRNEKMEKLLQKDDEMVREVKKLDSDMQMLVYENYNKFISATDTIRKMAQNVEGMEAEMADLGSSVDRISESSAKVNAALEGNRSKMDKLVRVRRLLQRLDFLFQLPQKLEEAVQEEQYAKAIRYFSMTKDILRKHSHVSSFGAIQRDCEDTVRRLQEKLQEEVNSPDVNRDTLVSHADLLLKLGVDSAGLKERYLEAHRRQLQVFLAASKGALVEDRSVSLDACLGKLAEGFLPMLLRAVQMYRQLFQRSGPTQRPDEATGGGKSKTSAENDSGANAEGDGEAGEGAHKAARDASTSATGPGARGAVVGEGEEQAGLVALAQSSVDGFFALLHAKVDHSLNPESASSTAVAASSGVRPDSVKAEGTTGGNRLEMGTGAGAPGSAGEEDELDAVALGGVVAAVQQLVSDMETVDPHVPQVFLARRAKEFAQDFKRSQVRRSFRVLCRSSLAVTRSLVAAVREGTPPEDLLLDFPEAGSASGWAGVGNGGPGGSGFGRSNTMSGGRRRRLAGGVGEDDGLPYQALVDRAVELFLKNADSIIVGCRPLSRLDTSPRPLADEMRYGLWGVILWLAAALRIVAGVTPDANVETLPPSEGREYDLRVEEEWGARAIAALGEPLPSHEVVATSGYKDVAIYSGEMDDLVPDAKRVQETEEGGTEGEVALLLACLCRGLGTTFVVRVPEIIGRQLPPTLDQSVHAPPPNFSSSVHSTRSAGSSTLHSAYTDRSFEGDDDSATASGGMGGAVVVLERRRQVDTVRNRVSAVSLSILDHYAEATGRKLADALQSALDAPPGGGDWFTVEEPTAVGESVLDALELAEDSVKEVCAFLGEARAGTVAVTRTGDRDLRRSTTPSLGGRSSNVGGVRRDIDRIFEAGGGMGARGSLNGATHVSFAADGMLAAVFRVALKAFGERARYLTLPGPGFRQVQLDADFLRQVLPYYVAESQMLSTLDRLLDQAIQSAADRSLDPTPLDSATAGDIVAQALDGFN